MYTLNCKGRLLVIEQPLVMGILNLTPDSFYSGSRANDIEQVLDKAAHMLQHGAAILDIGGQSTRPGSSRVPAKEELGRILEPIRRLRERFPDAYLSIDTYYGEVARAAVEAGADIINDVSAGGMDPEMIPAAVNLNVPYVLMHMKGDLSSMQLEANYDNVTREVADFFTWKMAELKNAGLKDIIIDPGFGFAKTIAHNFQLLSQLQVFKVLEAPLLLGISRKSMIYKTLGITAEEALNGTTVLHTVGLLNGADIIRTHDVRQTMEAIRLLQALPPKK